MMSRLFRPLDRYVFGEFWKIFIVTALGFPILLIVIDLTDHVDQYLNRKIPIPDIALSYVYWIPDSMFMVLPAAVLFATVFSIGAFSRHSELTAAKASGVSFYRMILPVFVGAILACGLDLVLGEVAPITNQRRSQLLQEDKEKIGSNRYNFAFAGEYGRVYKAYELRPDSGRIRLDLAYDGTGFSGWARQPGLRTVQGVLEDALATVFRRHDEPPRLTVAGRTDVGVHATGQVAQVRLQRGRVHRHQHVRRVAGSEDVEVGEVHLEAGHPGQGAGRRPDLRGEVGQRRDVVAQLGSLGREPVTGELHTVAGIAGEPDDHPIQLTDLLGHGKGPPRGGPCPSAPGRRTPRWSRRSRRRRCRTW